jgi:hypothetical protein
MGKSSRSTLGTQNPSPEATNPATTPPPEEPINIFVPMILEREREREREGSIKSLHQSSFDYFLLIDSEIIKQEIYHRNGVT